MEEETTISDGNQKLITFLRHFEMNRMQAIADTMSLYRAIYKDQNFENGLQNINKTLEFSKLQIKFVRCEATSNEYYVLYSTHYKNDVSWASGMYTDSQLDYFQNILKQILLSDSGAVSTIDCLNLNKKFTKNEAQDFLTELIKRQFLVKVTGGKVTLSPLSFCELTPFIAQHLGAAVNSCNICKKAVIYGVTCSECNIRMHKFCFEKYKTQVKRVKCPNCNAALAQENLDDDDDDED